MSARYSWLALLESLLSRRRLLSIDASGTEWKVVLVECCLEKVRILERITSVGAGMAMDDSARQLLVNDTIRDLGSYPLVIVVEGGREVSQVMELDVTEDEEVRRVIEKETLRVGHMGEGGNIVFDYSPLPQEEGAPAPYWVTLGNEAAIEKALVPFSSEGREICEVTSLPNAMIASAQGCGLDDEMSMLVHLGLLKTTFVVVRNNGPHYTSSIPFGLEFMLEKFPGKHTEDPSSPLETQSIETLDNVATAPVREWLEEIVRTLTDNRESIVPAQFLSGQCKVYVCGEGACVPELIDCLNSFERFDFNPWPKIHPGEDPDQSSRFAVAYGAALLAFKTVPHRASLLPATLRGLWEKALSFRRIQQLNLTLVCIVLVVFGIVLGQKLSLIRHKQELITQTAHVETLLMERAKIKKQLAVQYEQIRPVLELQKKTVDTLKALKAIRETATNKTYWYVLFADQESYFSYPINVSTNQTEETNRTVMTSGGPVDYGFIAELCLTEKGEPMRKTLTDLVDGLKKRTIFENVDTLSSDRRRFIVNTNVLIQEQHFALSLKLRKNEFEKPTRAAIRSDVDSENTASQKAGLSPVKPPQTNTFEKRLNNGLKEVDP